MRTFITAMCLLVPNAASAQAPACDKDCVKAYLQALQALREADPTGTQIYDRLSLKGPAAPKAKKPAPRPKLTFEQMLKRAPKRPVKLVAVPTPTPRSKGDAGGPVDRAACDAGDAEACNRAGRHHWDKLKGPSHDKAQVETLRAAAKWYGKACKLDKETACWEGIGLLQRLQAARPLRLDLKRRR